MKKFVLADPGAVLDQVYDLDRATERWMRDITTSLDPYMDGGKGTLGAVMKLRHGFEMPVLSHHRADAEIPEFHHFINGLQRMGPSGSAPHPTQLSQLFAESGMGTLRFDSPATGASEFFLQEFRRQQVADAAGLMIPHTRSGSVLFFTARQEQLARIPERAKPRWIDLKQHIAAVYDLRESLADGTFDERTAVWFDTNGSCVEAGPTTTPEVRERLRATVLQYENNRTARRAGQRVSLEKYWAAVMSGQWVILDRFDSDGRRYIVALPISEAGDTLRGLSLREREVLDHLGDGLSNKAIAFELGISTTSVSTHLYNIYRKLKLDDRAAVVRLVQTVRTRDGARLAA